MGQEALDHAIAAAELYMQAAGKARTPEDRKRLRRKFADLVALGERLKTAAKGPAPAVSPSSSRPLTTAEKTIILKASRLHGSVFPPWESAPGPESFTAATGPGGAYTCVNHTCPASAVALALANVCSSPSDPSPFSLSAEQQAIFAGWRRPAELAAGKIAGHEGGSEQFMAAQGDMDLAQDLATDCSVVASLCAATRHFGPTEGLVSS